MVQPAPCVIEPHYHSVRILHHNLERTRHVIALIPGQAEPVRLPGLIYLDPEIPEPNQKHIVLGKFMDTWSKLELMLRNKLQDLLLTPDQSTAMAISHSLSGRALAEMAQTLASLHLSHKHLREYISLMDRLHKLNTKRNYLVHGSWVVELVVGFKDGRPHVESFEAREYPPIDGADREALQDLKNQAKRSKYIFRIADIQRAEMDIGSLYKDFVKFHNSYLTRKRHPPSAGSR